MVARKLSDRFVRRARVRSQLLSGRVPVSRTVDAVVSTLVGVQAQDLTAAGLSVRARLPRATRRSIRSAPLVIAWTLRGTRHLHLLHEVPWIVRLLGPVANRPEGASARRLGIDGDVGRRAVAVLGDALRSEGPLTRRQVKDLLAPYGVDRSGQAPVHVIRRAALEGLLVVLPAFEGEERYLATDEPQLADSASSGGDARSDAAALASRYAAGFAPATADDFAAWSGLGLATARQAWADSGAPRDATLATAGATRPRPAGVRLLPAFDTFLLSYADRRLHLADEHAPRVNAGGGIVRPTILVDGVVTGTWSYHGDGVSVVELFRDLNPAEESALNRESASVRKFLTSSHRQ